jgi:hypothetical protein
MTPDCQRRVIKLRRGRPLGLYPEWRQVFRSFELGNKVTFIGRIQALLKRLNHKQFLAYPQAS